MRALLFFLLTAGVCVGAELKFQSHGKLVKTLSQEEIAKLVAPKEMKVYEPHEQKDVVYRGVPFNALLDAVYGSDWKKSEEVLFTCTDGYQPSVPLERFTRFTSALAWERVGSSSFTLINKLHNGETTELGPFYLVWDNIAAPALKADGPEGWPYEIVTVDLITFDEHFPNMAPPRNAIASAKRGFLAFRKHCMACHRINGEGGTKGVELNFPVSVVQYFKEPWLRRWITDAPSMRYETGMTSFKSWADKGWDEALDDLIAYLKVMAGNKRKPVADTKK
jgi:mono/diheme cytochrome c family protein